MLCPDLECAGGHIAAVKVLITARLSREESDLLLRFLAARFRIGRAAMAMVMRTWGYAGSFRETCGSADRTGPGGGGHANGKEIVRLGALGMMM